VWCNILTRHVRVVVDLFLNPPCKDEVMHELLSAEVHRSNRNCMLACALSAHVKQNSAWSSCTLLLSLVKTLLFPARILQATVYLCHYMNRPLHSCLHMQQFSWQRTSSRNVAAPVLHGPPPTVNRHDFNNSSSSSSISCSSKVSDTTPPCTKQAASLSCEI
jgi:hypothetical protein